MSARAVREAFRNTADAAVSSGAISAPRVETVNNTIKNEDRVETFFTLIFLGGSEEQVSLGDRDAKKLFRERGTVFANVHTKTGIGDDLAIQIADEIRDLFRATKIGGGAVTVESVSPPDTGDGDDRGKYFVATVDIAYRLEIEA